MEDEEVYEYSTVNRDEFYNEESISELTDDDEITTSEAGFMSGYLEL